jgi:hypothetical protein
MCAFMTTPRARGIHRHVFFICPGVRDEKNLEGSAFLRPTLRIPMAPYARMW